MSILRIELGVLDSTLVVSSTLILSFALPLGPHLEPSPDPLSLTLLLRWNPVTLNLAIRML